MTRKKWRKNYCNNFVATVFVIFVTVRKAAKVYTNIFVICIYRYRYELMKKWIKLEEFFITSSEQQCINLLNSVEITLGTGSQLISRWKTCHLTLVGLECTGMCTNEVAVNSVPTHKLSLAHGAQPEPANSQYLYSTIVEQKETGFHDSKAVFLNIKVCGYKYIEF